MHLSDTIVSKLVEWLVDKFGYEHILMLKDDCGTFGGILLGFLIGVIVTAFIIKDVRYVPDSLADTIKVTEMVKHKKHKMFIIIPSEEFPRLSIPTTIVIFIQALIVRIFPVQHLQFVDTKRKRIVTSLFISLLVLLSLYCIYFDSHAILSDGHGRIRLYHMTP